MRPICTVLIMTAVMALGFTAHAITFDGSTSGIFGAPDTASNPDASYAGVGTDLFTFGTPVLFGGPNSVGYNGETFSGVALDSEFALGTVCFHNSLTQAGTNVDSVPLDIELSFTSPPVGPTPFTYDLTFELGWFILPDAMVITPVGETSVTFDYDGVEYTVELLGFMQGDHYVDEIVVQEGHSEHATLYGIITGEPGDDPDDPIIPEPATLALTLLGTAAFGIARRRR